MSNIENILLKNRADNRHSLTAYLNCGDPDIETTLSMIKQCAENGIDVIELGVPFPNSFTDGGVVLRSHQRALDNKIVFEDVIQLVKELRAECKVPVVLLADFSHSVKPRGIKYIVEQCSHNGIDGILLHGLPPLYTEEFIEQTAIYAIDPIFSLYPTTSSEKIDITVKHSRGFIYLVTQYGRNGAQVDFRSDEINNFYSTVRQQTELPLMAGFGIKNYADMKDIFTWHAIDGVIVGSAICTIIESSLPDIRQINAELKKYLKSISYAKEIGYKDQFEKEKICDFAS